MKRLLEKLALFSIALMPLSSWAQSFDNSGNSLVKGTYFVRDIAFDNLSSAGLVGRARNITGTIAFDGNGNYSLNGQISDTTVSSGQPQSFTFSGQYSVSASGILEMASPLASGDVIYGGVGTSAIVGSSTEGTIFDMLVAIPVSSNATNASLSGQYRIGSIEYPGGDITQNKNATFLINADGKGNLGTLTVTGRSAATSSNSVTQTITGVQYSLSGTTGTMTFPLASGNTTQSQLVNGTKQFFVSSDGNILVGGALNGYDMLVGVRTTNGITSSNFSGTYYASGTDSDLSQVSSNFYYIDGYYGSLHVNGAGTLIAHQRINSSATPVYDYTADQEFTLNADGSSSQQFQQFFVGAGGQAVVLVGGSTTYSLELAVTATTLPASGSVYLNPIGVTNAATFAPITNPIAPGELINLYGTGLSSSTLVAQSLPLNSRLGNVSVTINGQAAPMYSVSPTEIVCQVPYEMTGTYATIQVNNSGTNSNSVTVFTENSAPGVFALSQNGIGPGATLHANGTVVSASSPANVGETVSVYVTGLGAVNPAVSDGAGAPSNPLSTTVDSFNVYVDATPATVTYAGLAPGFVGLYQVNFTIPSTPDTGEVYLDIEDAVAGGYTSMATIVVSNAASQ